MKGYAYLTMVLALALSCTTEPTKKIELAGTYENFENVISLADCLGPNGPYTTEVHSAKNTYTYFKQDYGAQRGIYEAAIWDANKGYSLDSLGQRKDTLSKESITIIKSHEFHKIHMFPNQFFKDLAYQRDTLYHGNKWESYIGKDALENEVCLFYDRSEQRITGFTMLNPANTSEKIQIDYLTWMDSPLGPVAKEVKITQGEKDIYRFAYTSVSFNEGDFSKKEVVE